jgi:hypothetical protein
MASAIAGNSDQHNEPRDPNSEIRLIESNSSQLCAASRAHGAIVPAGRGGYAILIGGLRYPESPTRDKHNGRRRR